MEAEPKLICVQHCQGLDVAQIYKSKLQAMEIPVLLEYESVGLVFGITTDGLGHVRVMVPESYAEEAQALLAEQDDDETGNEAEGTVVEESDSRSVPR